MAYKQRAMVYFNYFDTNHNGFIEPEDFSFMLKYVDTIFNCSPDDPNSVSKIFFDYISIFIEKLDTDNDGKLSKEEFLDGIEKFFVSKTFDTTPEWWRHHAAKVYTVFDTNKNGELSLEEVTSSIKIMNSKETDENIEKAYNWAITLSSSGKLDVIAWSTIVFIWATSPDPTPFANTLLPFFGMADYKDL